MEPAQKAIFLWTRNPHDNKPLKGAWIKALSGVLKAVQQQPFRQLIAINLSCNQLFYSTSLYVLAHGSFRFTNSIPVVCFDMIMMMITKTMMTMIITIEKLQATCPAASVPVWLIDISLFCFDTATANLICLLHLHLYAILSMFYLKATKCYTSPTSPHTKWYNGGFAPNLVHFTNRIIILAIGSEVSILHVVIFRHFPLTSAVSVTQPLWYG